NNEGQTDINELVLFTEPLDTGLSSGSNSNSSTSIDSEKLGRTCKETLKTLKKTRSKNEPCDAHAHIIVGDLEGLEWHLKNGSSINEEKLVEYALRFLEPAKIIQALELIKSCGMNFGKAHIKMETLAFCNENFTQDTGIMIKVLSWLFQNGYDVNEEHYYNHNTSYTHPACWIIGLRHEFAETYIYELLLMSLEQGLQLNKPYSLFPNILFYLIVEDFPVLFLELILKYDINFETKNKDGHDALAFAATRGKMEAVKCLLEHGFDPNTPINFYCPNILFYYIREHAFISFLELIIRNGVNLQTKNGEGIDALVFAAKNRYIEATKCLLTHGMSPNSFLSPNCPNVLFYYIKYAPVSFLSVVLKCDINLEKTNGDGLNALAFAVKSKNFEAMKYLLEHSLVFREEKYLKQAINFTKWLSNERSYLKSWQGTSGKSKRLSFIE
ncbi:4500_t:CDS:2, partial [Acaulospora morrowiae]